MGLTLTLVPVTGPGPVPRLAETDSDVAPLTAQLSVEDPPREIGETEAVNELITGSGTGSLTTMLVVFVTVPPALVAESV
ncbi:MAG: hypothetical protein NTV51_17700 [Verrucomicrobia bacterium]|nr:hypothetical protein [Verrucomicrobiota bacterium]